VIEEAISNCTEQGVPASGMHLKIVNPLPLMLKDIFSKFKKIVTVEVAYGDEYKPPPLAMILRQETLRDVQGLICKATGRPLRPRATQEKIKELLKLA